MSFFSDQRCPNCEEGMDNFIHIFKQCPLARAIGWFFNMAAMVESQNNKQDEFIKGMFKATEAADESKYLFVTWTTAMWFIWMARNEAKFRNEKANALAVCIKVKHMATDIYRLLHAQQKAEKKTQRRLCWEKPPMGWKKLNTDGSSKGNPGPAGAGGILRDEDGEVCWCFSLPISYGNSMLAETMACYQGMKIVMTMEQQRLQIETDSQYLAQLLLNKNLQPAVIIRDLINDIREMLDNLMEYKVMWKEREGNTVADLLATHATEVAQKKEWWKGHQPKVANASQQEMDNLEVFCSFWSDQYPVYIVQEVQADKLSLCNIRIR